MCGRVPDLQSGGCRFESQPGLLRTKVYSAFHRSGVGKWVSAAAGKAKAGMAHSDCGWTYGCAGKTVKSLENTCHTRALLRWWFITKRRYIKCMHFYLLLFAFTHHHSSRSNSTSVRNGRLTEVLTSWGHGLPDSATSADAVDLPIDRFWLDREIKLNTTGKQINTLEVVVKLMSF